MDRIEKYGLTRSNKVENAMNTWKKRSNSAYAFVTDMIEKSSTEFIKHDAAFNLYLSYCDENDFVAFGKSKLTIEFEKIGAISGLMTEAQARVKIYKGVKLKKKIMPEMKPEEESPTVF